MFNTTNIKYLKPKELLTTIGINYTKFGKYIPQNPVEWAERYDFVENYLNGNRDPSYLKAKLTGLPILNRYGILEYTDAESNQTEILLETLVITLSRTKNITTTNIQGVDGTVKEFINLGDYVVNITGSFIGRDAWHYDEDSITDFVSLMNIKDSITINNQYLNELYNISSIAVTNFEVVQSPELSNIVFYKIDALSNFDDNQIISR